MLSKTMTDVFTARDNNSLFSSEKRNGEGKCAAFGEFHFAVAIWSSIWVQPRSAWEVDPIPCFDAVVQAIFDFRFLTLMAVVGSLAGSLLCFLKVTLHLESFPSQKNYLHVIYNLRIWNENVLSYTGLPWWGQKRRKKNNLPSIVSSLNHVNQILGKRHLQVSLNQYLDR